MILKNTQLFCAATFSLFVATFSFASQEDSVLYVDSNNGTSTLTIERTNTTVNVTADNITGLTINARAQDYELTYNCQKAFIKNISAQSLETLKGCIKELFNENLSLMCEASGSTSQY